MSLLIDAHAHVVLPTTMGAAGDCGPEIGWTDGAPWFRVCGWHLHGVAYENSPFTDVDLRLAAMDTDGIDAQILSPNPLTYFHHIAPDDAAQFCATHNDALAGLLEGHRDRLAGFAALPIQSPELAAVELRRAVSELGLLGGYIGTDFRPGLDAPEMDGFYEVCTELDVPLMVHPAPSGIDGPRRDERMARFDLDLVAEFSYEELMAVASLIFGGVLHRHPGLDVCISHGGGSTPMHLAKLRRLAERRASVPAWLRPEGAFDDQVARLWFDLHVTGSAERDFAVSQLGADRLVFGTNFAGWDGGDAGAAVGLEPVLADNAVRLFRLDSRAPAIVASREL